MITASTPKLTKEHLKVLKMSDTVCPMHKGKRAFLRCFKKKDELFESVDEGCYEIDISARFSALGHVGADDEFNCFAHFTYLKSLEPNPMRSLITLMREGDAIKLEWWIDGNNTPALKEAGLFADSLYIIIYRKGEPKHKFLMSTSICADNSARMIKKTLTASRVA